MERTLLKVSLFMDILTLLLNSSMPINDVQMILTLTLIIAVANPVPSRIYP